MEYQELDELIDQLEENVGAAESGKRNWKEIWGDIRYISQQFKVTRYPSKAKKMRLGNVFSK